MILRFLRLAHFDEVQETIRRIFIDILAEIFIMQRYMLENLHSWFITGLKFFFFTHYLACGWVTVELAKELAGVRHLEFVEKTVTYRYFESFYLITTTITTVGYGDYKAFNDEEPIWMAEMIFLYTVALVGTLLFSSVTNSVFNYNRLRTVNEIVSETRTLMEEYLYNVSKVNKDKFLGEDYINESLNCMEEAIRTSTRYYFEDNHHYQDLPEVLKRRLT